MIWKYNELHQLIKTKKTSFSNSTYYKYLRSKKYINYSWKKYSRHGTKKLNEDNNKSIRKEYSRKFAYSKCLKYVAIYIDECIFNLNLNMLPAYGWTPKGKGSRLPIIFSKSKNLSLLAAITEDRVLCCQLFIGPVKCSGFFKFLAHMIKQNLFDVNKHVLILHNCSIHFKKEH